ncbi:MAG: hypothetical protein IKP95_02080 [Ruminococcus sp.]|nr:hypothetical protein [Ruminococcus sp.]
MRRIKSLIAVLASALMLCAPVTAFAVDEPVVPGEGDTVQADDTAGTGEEETDQPSGEEASYSLALTAAPDKEQCAVGDVFVVTLSVTNTGDKELTSIEVFFEEYSVKQAESLAAGESLEFTIKLKAWPEDIDSGGIINVSATAAELEDPVKTSCNVKVVPAEEEPEEKPAQEEPRQEETRQEEPSGNPPTGLAGSLALAAMSFAAIAVSVKHKGRE